MRMARRGSPKWVLKRITYFDHETHRFRTGDIEIDGEWISAVRAPGASMIEYAVDGRAYTCAPGLIHARADSGIVLSESAHLLEWGITTAGIVCATAGECIRTAAHSHVRLIAHLLLNAFSAARVQQRNHTGQGYTAEIRFLEKTSALLSRSSAHLLPAVHCPSIVSAQELIYAQDIAAALHRKLGFMLSDSVLAAQTFRERFYCSETQLLEFMQLLRSGASIWVLSQLTRTDVRILMKSDAQILGLNALGMRKFRRPYVHKLPAIPPTNLHSPFSAIDARHSPYPAFAADCDLDADAVVDAATILAAAALGDPTCGRIASGMRADLCLFATPHRELSGLGSEAFIDLFERGWLRLVLLGGKKAHESPSAIASRNSLPPKHRTSPAPHDVTGRL